MQKFIILAILITVALAAPNVQFTHPLAGDVLDAREYIVVTYEFEDMPLRRDSANYEFFMIILGFGEQVLRNEPISLDRFRRGRYDFATTLGENTAYGYKIRITMANYTNVEFTSWDSERFTIVNSRDSNKDPLAGTPGVDPDRTPNDYTPSYPAEFDPNHPSSAGSRLRPFWF